VEVVGVVVVEVGYDDGDCHNDYSAVVVEEEEEEVVVVVASDIHGDRPEDLHKNLGQAEDGLHLIIVTHNRLGIFLLAYSHLSELIFNCYK
jgi:predicted TIM-barrel fold metal-dependent hydrolase